VIILAMTITDWVPMAILVRGQVLQLKEAEYSLASESLGADQGWILRKHILPNTLGPILVNVTLTIPRAIFAEATLGFLGLGLQAPKSSLGTLANDGLAGMAVGLTYQIIFPALLISLIMFSFNVLGDGLRDALDPRLRK
ncbi:ABC transporter permease, partial [Vibrio parahaemolyticus]|nr:ABC transporter permease [Vibrio parahaemolyticus]